MGENIADNGGLKQSFRVRITLFIVPVKSKFGPKVICNVVKLVTITKRIIFNKCPEWIGNESQDVWGIKKKGK